MGKQILIDALLDIFDRQIVGRSAFFVDTDADISKHVDQRFGVVLLFGLVIAFVLGSVNRKLFETRISDIFKIPFVFVRKVEQIIKILTL
jgi:hypothetical protein